MTTATVQLFAIHVSDAQPVRTIADQEAALDALFRGYRVQLRGRPVPSRAASAEDLLGEIRRIVDAQQPIAA